MQTITLVDVLPRVFADDSIPPSEVWRADLGYLPQELSLFSGLTAMENIRLKNDLTRHVPESRIGEWMERLGIADRRDWPAGRMSVGQQQRVAKMHRLRGRGGRPPGRRSHIDIRRQPSASQL